MLKSKLAMTYFMCVLLRPLRNDRKQFQRNGGNFVDFQVISSHLSKLDVYYILCFTIIFKPNIHFKIIVKWPSAVEVSNVCLASAAHKFGSQLRGFGKWREISPWCHWPGGFRKSGRKLGSSWILRLLVCTMDEV